MMSVPAAGTDIMVGERSVGTLGSVVGSRGLAIARIDRVKEAMDSGMSITAAGTPLTLAIPAFAKFGFPENVTAGEA
jgi:tRNA-modifying protein YgfZ